MSEYCKCYPGKMVPNDEQYFNHAGAIHHVKCGCKIRYSCDDVASKRVISHPTNIRAIIDAIREPEGNSIEFLCPNPEAGPDSPNEIVVVTAHWTKWQPKRYGGNTLDQALMKALMDAPESVHIRWQKLCEGNKP